MVKGPGFYADIGRRAKDLLFKDYQNDQKFTITTYTAAGAAMTIHGTKKGDSAKKNEKTKEGELYFADVSAQLKHQNITTYVKVDSNSNVFTSIAIDTPAPGLKFIISSSKVEVEYMHKYAGISTSIGLKANPILNFSGLAGNDKLALGTDLSFDTSTSTFTKCNAGLSFSSRDLHASLTVKEHGNIVSASYYHLVHPLTNTAVGAEMTRCFSSNRNTLTIGSQHSLDNLTFVKARVNSHGKANALLQYKWLPKSLFTISGEVDTKAIKKSAKIGLSISLRGGSPRREKVRQTRFLNLEPDI